MLKVKAQHFGSGQFTSQHRSWSVRTWYWCQEAETTSQHSLLKSCQTNPSIMTGGVQTGLRFCYWSEGQRFKAQHWPAALCEALNPSVIQGNCIMPDPGLWPKLPKKLGHMKPDQKAELQHTGSEAWESHAGIHQAATSQCWVECRLGPDVCVISIKTTE